MELFRTNDFYIFVKGEYSLWWDRQTATFIPKTGWDLTDADDPICLGICDALIGKVEHPSVFGPRLLLVKESLPVGTLHGDNVVYKIKTIVLVPAGNENVELNLRPCRKHQTSGSAKKNSNVLFDIQKNAALTKTWGTLKNAGNTIKNTTQQAAAMATGVQKKPNVKDKERFEKQIIEEFYKIFTDTNSFYYSHTTDLTNSLQRLCNLEKTNTINLQALWRTVDDRFFWNKHMLQDLINLDKTLCDPWILPIIQGYIQIENCKVPLDKEFQTPEKTYELFTLCILSRRSRFRAGTRYKRRGVNENGECANYVETEQLVAYQSHEVSFVQVRGSVPVYWSQPGYKYRPPPKIDKGEAETNEAFEKHFTNEIHKYGPVCVVNLIDQTGKERVIFDAYSNHILHYNSSFITYVTFDFHEYCRGMHFENVTILVNALADVIKDMNYCWKDKQGHICSQNGVFRINCIDCLDRTNVVQTALGKAVMEMQFCKLGLISPEGTMPNNIRNTFQLLWANNGDIISKQYAGTNALKGDYTRTGERKFTGIMKDGMNSANRFFRNHFADSIRQCCLDIMQDNPLDDYEIESIWYYINKIAMIIDENLPNTNQHTIYTPHISLEQEFLLAEAIYHLSRYYLSRFKDSTRQGTIDLMLGNYVSEENFKAQTYEEDSLATAEHVKLLIEDCKKMLLNQPENVLGAWGLINADPIIGDPTETEMDTILILTKTSYFIADYDDQVDKITKYQKVGLEDLLSIECGFAETNNSLLFRSSKNCYCIRLNYRLSGAVGYYHMFRSTNLRFFNNMAVVIKNEEEEVESLKAIGEAFTVALDIAQLPKVPCHYLKTLDKRRSKVPNSEHDKSSIYLDIAALPQMTRNVSESQLLALKSVGTKAISNVTQQFSKIGNTFKKRKPNFSVGTDNPQETSSDSDEDYNDSIFQQPKVEEAIEATEELLAHETFLPSVGIVMGNTNEGKGLKREDSSQVDDIQLSSIVQNVTLNPEIHIDSVAGEPRKTPPNSLQLDRKLSHSSGEVDENDRDKSLSQSQSESALKTKFTNITSPVASATKDLVLSPFSKLAKGVQNLGANLDPRKLSGHGRQISEKDMEEHRRLKEQWKNSKTRLIAL